MLVSLEGFSLLTSLGNKLDLLYRIAKAGQSKTNATRNIVSLINRNDLLLPVPIETTQISVAVRRPKYSVQKMWWPILRMQDWVRVLLQEAPQILLAGVRLEDTACWQRTFRDFWGEFKNAHPEHCIYQSGFPLHFCVPYFLHGDEGRTHRQRSFMVESFQPVISHKGPTKTNESGHL